MQKELQLNDEKEKLIDKEAETQLAKLVRQTANI